jgi:hypothetical protein
VVDGWGREFAGQAAIHEWSNPEFIGQYVKLTITQITRDGETTVVTADVGSDGFNGPSNFSFELDGDQVTFGVPRASGRDRPSSSVDVVGGCPVIDVGPV